MPSIEENRAWSTYDWSQRGDEWSSGWGSSEQLWFGSLLARIHWFLPAAHILEIAPGHGRCTQFLHRYCNRLTVVDLTPECIDACRQRFKNVHHIEYHVNDGLTLPMVADESIDFVFSWDSLVHVEQEVMASYLRELGTKLKPGAFGFFHHSNLAAVPPGIVGSPPLAHDHWRGKTMSAEKLRELCLQSGLHCVSQELIPWAAPVPIDAFSLFHRPLLDEALPPTRVQEHSAFMNEQAAQHLLGALYSAPNAGRSSPQRQTRDDRPWRYQMADRVNDLFLRALPGVHDRLYRSLAKRASRRP